ncbi:MAG: SET domain-containing protein-lysine N-methyltransferase [Bryobacterales bacterium]|nr:SET domain-containing protein-lysine N-methyltransferase [Bryobacterales bacterium]
MSNHPAAALFAYAPRVRMLGKLPLAMARIPKPPQPAPASSQASPAVALKQPEIDPAAACFRLEVRPSSIHRWGVYALEPIPARRKVIEYTGERISRRETKRRGEERELHYLFTLNSYWTIDGSVGGSGAEYINHSCEPNILARIVGGHILYYSKRAIAPGEELLVDYRFDEKMETVPCRCGAPSCRGTINLA